MFAENQKILTLSGGVGGAKLVKGLTHCLTPEQLMVVANTGDDFEHFGLRICPDLDTLMYTLAGLNDNKRGWGLARESWQALSALEQLSGDTWFKLGDKDLATHLIRTQLINEGKTLTEVTTQLFRKLGGDVHLLPMSDDPVSTIVETADGDLSFQHYFVREHCMPAVTGFRFDGVELARPQNEFLTLLQGNDLAATVICPSNPFVSIDPILTMSGVRDCLIRNFAPVIAISPIVAGKAIKGPAAKMMQELSIPANAIAVAQYYGDLLDGFVIDESDACQAEFIEALGIKVLVTSTIMNTLQDRIDLAQQALKFSKSLV
ncbi:MAG: 2-phospho-L-lactate transferase [Porticoccaceae bacterium]|jgi:LPPG:FO 2-phospho-L-lactate transferase